MVHRHFLAALLLAPIFGLAAEASPSDKSTCGDWGTTVQYPGGTMRLHWTHVYEGKDTVYRIEFLKSGKRLSTLKVEGQPVFNSAKTLAAIPYCADDGCNAEVQVVDLTLRQIRTTVKLPYKNQIYFAPVWRGEVLVVPVESFDRGQRIFHKHEFDLSAPIAKQ